MSPQRYLAILAALALATLSSAQTNVSEGPEYAIPDSETWNPPTPERLATLEGLAERTGWYSVAVPARSAAMRAYGQDRFIAADAWFNVYQWLADFSEPENMFYSNWIQSLQAENLPVPAGYRPSDRPIGINLSNDLKHWLLSNQAFSQEFFSTITSVDNLPRVYAILEGLRRRDAAKFARYASLALALAVVYDVEPPSYWPHHQVTEQALPRKLPNPALTYEWLTHEDMLGRTYFRLARLRAEELKFVVDTAAPVSELEWSQLNVPYPLDHFEGAYSMVKYRSDRLGEDSLMTWSGQPYTLQAILQEGGICVDQAYFATEAGKARGVPTLLFSGSGQNSRHAWFGFLDAEGKWRLDAGRYADHRLVTGTAIDPQSWLVISDHDLQFLAERFRALPSFQQSSVHLEFARVFLQEGDAASSARAARKAVNYERRNLGAWEVLIAADTKLGYDPAKLESVLREAALALSHYPDLLVWYKNRICSSLRARGETSLANAEERSIAESRKGDRADLATQQAASILARSIDTQPIPTQIATYNSIMAQFGHGAGTMFFDEVVVGFAEHLALVHMRPQAREAVERAREALEVQPGTQLALDVDKLMARLQD
jgi:hypothetical protein